MNEFMENQIMLLCKMPTYQRLNAYYKRNTIFDILGTQRSESHHSAFIAWLLNPGESHNLQDRALRQFLALAAYKANDPAKCYYDSVRKHLITGNYQIKVDCVKTEQTIVGLAGAKRSVLNGAVEQDAKGEFKKDRYNRFDIWILLQISFTTQQGADETWTIPVVIENKIYSKESNSQTERYTRAMGVLQNVVCNNNYCQPLLTYLTPSGATAPKSDAFIHLTYQDLLEHVIQPCADTNSCAESDIIINGYIRNLSCPSNGNNDNEKDYSILAISEMESADLETIFNTDIYQTTLCNIYFNESKKLIGTTGVAKTEPMLEQFWEANERLFKTVLYNHFRNNEDKLKVVKKIIKTSNRDNTRYYISTANGVLNTKPASKSEASFLIFKAYCQMKYDKQKRDLTIDELRKEFDCSLNNYYYKHFLNYLFYDFTNPVKVDFQNSKYYDQEITPNTYSWDFYWDEAHILPHVKGEVRSVKMWRQDDFAQLIDKARKLGIIVDEQ